MAQEILDLGIIGDDNTGDFVFEAMSKIQNNFDELYTNKASISDVLLLTGGEMLGHITMGDYSINGRLLEFVHSDVPTVAGSIYSLTTADNGMYFGNPSTPEYSMRFNVSEWRIGTDLILTEASIIDPTKVSFGTYLSLTSTNISDALKELKDEFDGLAAGSGTGDMLKSTYDTGNNGIVDNSEKLNNQVASYYLSRTNHTGTQIAATISDFDTEVSNNPSVAANTAKISNQTHTGDVTGVTALTISNNVIGANHLNSVASPTSGQVLSYNGTNLNWITNPVGIVYSSGAFTASLIDLGGGATYTATVNCTYSKVHRSVTFAILMTGIQTVGTPTGILELQYLPFTTLGPFAFEVNMNGYINQNYYSIKAISSGLAIRFKTQSNFDDIMETLSSVNITTGSSLYITGSYYN